MQHPQKYFSEVIHNPTKTPETRGCILKTFSLPLGISVQLLCADSKYVEKTLHNSFHCGYALKTRLRPARCCGFLLLVPSKQFEQLCQLRALERALWKLGKIKPSGSDLFGGFFFLFLFLLTVVPFPFSFFSFRSGSKGKKDTYPVKGNMNKLFFVLIFLPFAGYGQEITITQSQKIDLKLPGPEQPGANKGNQKAKGLLIAGAALSAAGVGIGLSGSVSKPAQDRALRVIGSGVVAVGAGFTIAGVVKMK